MSEYLETRSDKSISSSSLCDFASIILKNNYFRNDELKSHQKEVLLLGPSWLVHILTCLCQGFSKQ